MSSSEETRRVAAPRCVMLVDVPTDLERRITRALVMTLLRAKHVMAACERMVTMCPLVVVVGGTPTANELASLEENAIAIGAQVVLLSKLENIDALEGQLALARAAAEKVREQLRDAALALDVTS